MTILDSLSVHFQGKDAAKLPPVELWNPPFCGDIDICIKANGDWYQSGIRFTRPALVKLLSGLIKKEGNEYFLVTPVEKLRISVEDAPLIVIGSAVTVDGVVVLETRTEDRIVLSQKNPLIMRPGHIDGERKPYVLVRRNLEALVHRNVFYHLVEQVVQQDGKYGILSGGDFFSLE